jgi:outer membrane receptor protein involved in Fe transport
MLDADHSRAAPGAPACDTSALRKLLLAALIGELLCTSGFALAQEAAPATPASRATPPASKVPAVATTAPAAATTAQSGQGTAEVPSVTVSAERPTNRIDRQVYDVKSNVSSTNGSAADALNNVPSVSVDPDGTVSLRGSTHVQIYIDGKPSAGRS